MKIKITISGSRVHDVGYRVFLMKHAMNLALPGLSTYNWDENDQQEVIALVEGDEARIAAFRHLVEKNKPELAEVSKVTFEDYNGEVGRTSEVAMFCSFVQLDKAIPLLLDMRNDLKEMKGDTKEMKGDIKDMKGDTKAVRKNTDAIPQVLEDLPGYATNFRQMQADIRSIKERLGMS
jgi:acylphosphatase